MSHGTDISSYGLSSQSKFTAFVDDCIVPAQLEKASRNRVVREEYLREPLHEERNRTFSVASYDSKSSEISSIQEGLPATKPSYRDRWSRFSTRNSQSGKSLSRRQSTRSSIASESSLDPEELHLVLENDDRGKLAASPREARNDKETRKIGRGNMIRASLSASNNSTLSTDAGGTVFPWMATSEIV